MKAKLYFSAENDGCVSFEINDSVKTFAEFCDQISPAAPAGLLVFPGSAHSYSALIRIEKLED